MGGTTAKASLIEGGSPAYLSTYYVGGYEHGLPLLAPVIDIHEVGAGGGSIAWLDEASALHVGPRGAGSQPGPACYALGGTRPTVTDAKLYNLIAFGGAGPIHASAIARLLHAQRVVIPPAPGVFSALGMLHMPLRTDRTRSVLLSLDDEGLVHARRLIDELLVELGAIAEDAPGSEITSGASLKLRYRGAGPSHRDRSRRRRA